MLRHLTRRLARAFAPAISRRPAPAQLLLTPLEDRVTPAGPVEIFHSGSVNEGADIVFTIRHNGVGINDGGGGSHAKVTYKIGGGTALTPFNYTVLGAAEGTVTLAPGATFPITVRTKDNGHHEDAKSIIGRIISAPGSTIMGGSATAAIFNINPPPDPVFFNLQAPPMTLEGNPGSFTVTRTGDLSKPAFVSFGVVAGSARPQDYSIAPRGVLQFGPNVDSLPIPFTTAPNDVHEGQRSFEVYLFGAGPGSSIKAAKGLAGIRDDDPKPSIIVSQIDSMVEGETDTITVSLSNPTAYWATVRYTRHGFANSHWGTDVVLTGDTGGTLNFKPYQNTPHTFTVRAMPDRIVEGQDHFQLIFTPGPHVAAGNASVGFYVVDTTVPKVSLFASQSVWEGDSPHAVTFSARLVDTTVEAGGSLGVHYRTVQGGAKPGTDYVGVDAFVEITGGTAANFTITILGNKVKNASVRDFSIELLGSARYTIIGAPITVKIVEDDQGIN